MGGKTVGTLHGSLALMLTPRQLSIGVIGNPPYCPEIQKGTFFITYKTFIYFSCKFKKKEVFSHGDHWAVRMSMFMSCLLERISALSTACTNLYDRCRLQLQTKFDWLITQMLWLPLAGPANSCIFFRHIITLFTLISQNLKRPFSFWIPFPSVSSQDGRRQQVLLFSGWGVQTVGLFYFIDIGCIDQKCWETQAQLVFQQA